MLENLFLILKGMLTGAAGILPGFSGGVMMLVFGIYEPLMELLANPLKKFKKHVRLLLWVACGWALGFWLGAKLLARIFTQYETEATCLFIGIMIGMLPPLFKDAVSRKNKKASYATLVVTALVMTAFFMYLKYGAGLNITPNIPWYLFCGIMWGISLIVPGMSSSSVLMFMGLYLPMTEGIGNLNMAVIIPWAVGIVASVLLLSKAVGFLFDRYYSTARCVIIGVVIASVISIVPTQFAEACQVGICVLMALLGVLTAAVIGKIEKKITD